MPLQIKSICIKNFRSYSDLRLENLGRLTVFVGPNAVGKTSIIEAIQLMTSLTSFRHCTFDEMIKFGEVSSQVETFVSDNLRQLKIKLSIEDKSRTYTLNEKTKRIHDLRGLIPAVTFSPDDLDLVKGSISNRRHALDQLGVQLNANYSQIAHDFEKIHKHKTKLLKEGATNDLLDAVNETFACVSTQLTNYRARMFERLLPYIQSMYASIANSGNNTSDTDEEKITGEYIASWQEGQAKNLIEAINVRTQEEQVRGRALEGAHLDKINFSINGLDAQKFASQGQQRSLVLAWKLAEVELINEMLGQLPILLLDDVMSELDSNRRAALIQYLSRDLQAFITTTNAEYFTKDMLSEAEIIQLPLQ